MLLSRKLSIIGLSVLSLTSLELYAAIDPAAPAVLVRTSCNDGAGGELNNCFTNFSSLNSWIWGTRKPTDATPLQVDIGPGTFGQYACGDAISSTAGNIGFRGAGIDKTTLASITLMSQCASVSFSDMTIGGTGVNYSVVVVNPGTKTTWTNVRLASPNIWQEYCAGGATGGRHNWFGSTLEGRFGGSYEVKCDQSWFYGSEISTKGPVSFADVIPFKVSGSELHVYGSVIRALGKGTAGGYSIKAVQATGGEIHIHGTGIDTLAVNGAPADITVFDASNGASIHAYASSYSIKTGAGGTVTRINNNAAEVNAPFFWQSIPDPSTVPGFTTVNGADTATVTSGTSDGHPHTVVYSSTCPPGTRWYDQVDKVCRGQ